MITAPSALQTLLKESHSLNTQAGCTIEYNWNQMTNLTDSNVTSSGYWQSKDGVYPFKKLFPMDSIIKPFRPNAAGIKYAIINNSNGIDGETKVYRPNGLTYPQNYRIYYPGSDNTYKYWISQKDAANQYLAILYPKDIVTNKIVIKFEISHSIPTSFNVVTAASGATDFSSPTTIFTGTNSSIPSFTSTDKKPGVLTLYYNGSSWSTDESTLSMSSYATIKGIKLNLTTISGYVGVIEMSPRWIKDISEYVERFEISKESSSQSEDIVPVGYVSSNSLQMSIFNYNTSTPQIITYNPETTSVDSTKLYMYKNAELRPYIKFIHANGASGTTGNKYDIVYQGYFYIQSWDDSNINDVSIVALDGAKTLQDTLCPLILCKDYSASAAIRRLLDSIGFTTYNFNYKTSNGSVFDNSVISLNYWWTESGKTVWAAIQELCRDTQMTAVFDENGVLQFYSRDYMYDSSRQSSWGFTYDSDGSTLSNIENLNRTDLPIANQVKILWKGATTSEFSSDTQPLWSADPTTLAGAGLMKDLAATGDAYIELKPVSAKDSGIQSLLSYSGYLVVDDEIIEYDAIEYRYTPLGQPGTSVVVDVTDSSDLLKYRSLAEPGSTAFAPTGRYRIKSRGAFGTTASAHYTGKTYESWDIKEITVQ